MWLLAIAGCIGLGMILDVKVNTKNDKEKYF